jgi:hypothetical protein
MRRSVTAVAAALAVASALVLAGCGDDDDGATAGSPPDQPPSPVAKQFASAEQTSEAVYEGTLSIDVDYYGYDCQLQDTDLHLEASRTYEMPVQVIRGAPAEAGGLRESSPFNLIIGADPGNEAGLGTVSATVATAPDGTPVLFEYWRMNVQGASVDAELTNSWRQAGLVLNIFPTDTLIVPCRPELGMIPGSIQPIEEGARMSGTITDEQVELTISGQTTNHERRFEGRVTASRSS